MSTGSSNRLIYDNCFNEQRNTERVSPLEYQLYDGKYRTCNWCGTKNTPLNSELQFNERVDIETDLFNISRKQSRCDGQKYKPPCDNPTSCQLNNNNFVNHLVCDREVVWTNLIKPTNTGLPSNYNHLRC